MIEPATINRLLNASTIEELWDMHTRRMAQFGFDRLIYGCTRFCTPTSLGDPDDFVVLSNHAPGYIEAFVGDRLYFNAPMVRHLLLKAGVAEVKYRRRKPELQRAPDEWTIRELAEHIGMPEPTLYTWVQQGRLRCRLAPTGTRHVKLIHADPDTIAALKAVRATPAPWHRRPPRPTPPTES